MSETLSNEWTCRRGNTFVLEIIFYQILVQLQQICRKFCEKVTVNFETIEHNFYLYVTDR